MNAFGIKTIAWLIQDQQPRLGQKCLSQGQARAHSVRIGFNFGFLASRQANPLDHFTNTLPRSWSAIVAQDFQVPPAAQVIIKHGGLEDRADLLQRLQPSLGYILSTKQDFSARRPDLA